jgi:membrane protease YdiL (CAAX protease family)
MIDQLYAFPVETTWTHDTTRVFVPVVAALVCFVSYWFTSISPQFKARFQRHHAGDEAATWHIFAVKFTGFLTMGVLPLAVCMAFIPEMGMADYGLTMIPATSLYSLAWTMGLCVLVVPLASFSARKPKNLLNYPQNRATNWTRRIYALNLLGWAVYLFGYEFLFRGILLFPLAETLGVWPAIAVNIALYSATHIPKGLDETLGAIPLGLVLCLLTLASGTIWIAFLVHVAMAWTNSLTALKHHPDIHYQPGT